MMPKTDFGYFLGFSGLGAAGAWSIYVEPALQGALLVGSVVGMLLLVRGRILDNRIKKRQLKELEEVEDSA
ncbi:hypothetical protein [Flexibacterium corallicola]|uniref:hypothetical protein n=1 Tax=Flexibacterium corallicola TaxID=3037259 RepID=UPI00286F0BDA|nr:hypothetical protein [Pseudovibrio sp. M1P-2-3]